MLKTAVLVSAFLLSLSSSAAAAAPAFVPTPEGALAAMGDGGDSTGVWLAEWFRSKGGQIRYDASLPGPSAFRIEGSGKEKRPVVLLNENIKGRTDGYKYYAALLAREISEMIHVAMPESAEKRYMIYACPAEVFFELWGTRLELPVFSGVRDEALGDQVSIWVENDPEGGADAIASMQGVKRLKTLIAEEELKLQQAQGDGADTQAIEKRLGALRSEKDYFDNQFKNREKYWWMLFQPQ